MYYNLHKGRIIHPFFDVAKKLIFNVQRSGQAQYISYVRAVRREYIWAVELDNPTRHQSLIIKGVTGEKSSLSPPADRTSKRNTSAASAKLAVYKMRPVCACENIWPDEHYIPTSNFSSLTLLLHFSTLSLILHRATIKCGFTINIIRESVEKCKKSVIAGNEKSINSAHL